MLSASSSTFVPAIIITEQKTQMEKLLKIPFSASLRNRIHHFPFTNNSKLPLPNTSNRYPISHSITLLKWISSFSPLPPPEWVQPTTDLSDLVTTDSKKDLQPSPWVLQILNLLHKNTNLEQDLTEYCRKFLIKLPPNFVAYILKKSDHIAKQPETAYRFFIWASKQRGYTHSLECYVFMIEILSLARDLDRIKFVFNEFKRKGFLLNSIVANSFIRSFGSVGMVEELLWVWKMMKENEIEPSLYTYNCLMNGLVSSEFVESAERVFEVMENGKIKPDMVTYNTIIKGYGKAGRLKKAMERFQGMELKNVEPDKITYMTLMQACYSQEDYDCCLRLYHEMKEKGLDIPPHAYSLVISGLCKDGKSMEGYSVFENMIQNECRPNTAIYTALIDSYAKNRNLDIAMGLFQRMQSEGFEPDEITYGVIVNGLCKSGKLENALQWFEYCRSNNVSINTVFYSSLIDGLGKAGRIDEAEKLFEEMVEKGCSRDSYCYNVFIDALAKSGQVDEALTLFKRMEDEGCDRTVYTYTILLSGLFKERRNEEALKLWDMMIDKGITPNDASFRVLSTGLCLSGKVARACNILDELAPMGIVVETAFQHMICVLCKAGRIAEACKLADGVVERGREIPGKVRTIMINALRKAGNADLAMKLVHSKIGIGYDRLGSVKRRVKFRNLVEN